MLREGNESGNLKYHVIQLFARSLKLVRAILSLRIYYSQLLSKQYNLFTLGVPYLRTVL